MIGVVAGVIVFVRLIPILHDAPTVSRRLLGAGFPLLVVAAEAGVFTLMLVYRGRYSTARIFAVTTVGAVVAGWGVGQYPWMLVDQITFDQAAGADTALAALLVVVALAVVIVLPAFGYLLRLTQTDRLEPNLRTSAPP